ncbi:MAG: hypothetical protein IJF20_04455 [Clostridia bacterium]|nr:hypothetical protein [Clostridia bacterium]
MERIEDYLNSVVPQNISKKKKQKIYDELQSHILDRFDYYKETGYEECDCIEKALADMGESEDVKKSIRKEFEELHIEKTWWSVVIGIILLCFDYVTAITDVLNIFAATGDYYIPDFYLSFKSFVVITLLILLTVFCYRKGYRKCLFSLGISNLIIGLCPLFCWYSCQAICSIVLNSGFVIDRTTTFVIDSFSEYPVSVLIMSRVFVVLFAVVCIILSEKIKRHGKPEQKNKKGVAAFMAVMCLVSVSSSVMIEKSGEYFEHYPRWFVTDPYQVKSCIAEMDYYKIKEGMLYDDVVKMLKEEGYFSVEDFEKTLDWNMALKFRHNYEELNLKLDEEYEVYFYPTRDYIHKEYYYPSNGIIYISKGEGGLIESKGIGIASEIGDEDYNIERVRDDNFDKCIEDFKNLKAGDGKSSVLDKFGAEYGENITLFTTYTDSGTEEYYRFYINDGYHEYYDAAENDDGYAEIYFTDNKLSQGILHVKYYEKEQYKRTEKFYIE